MYCLNKSEMHQIAPLFEGWDETLIWSCLQGHMGNAWVDKPEHPHSAQIITGVFCFYAGIPHIQLVRNIPENFASPFILAVPQNEAWAQMIEKVHPTSERFMRYAIKKEPGVFNPEKLRENVRKLDENYSIQPIDEALYHKIREYDWTRDLCSQFPTYEAFKTIGMGFVVLHQGEIVCGASSYTVYDGGIEIEIDTHENYRRQGLALACASRLILECLDRNLYPSWDAANKASVALAEKLGYHFEREYVTYYVALPRNEEA